MGQTDRQTVTYSGTKLDKQIVQTGHFQHATFDNGRLRANALTWVFIDGDGNAWLRDGLASEDPTPGDPLALRLMLDIAAPGLYLARPCTFDLARLDPRCSAQVWTVDRYSEAVIESMQMALRERLADVPVVLVGFSGGGVLALQLAQRAQNAVGVVTIASNLDVGSWVEHHGYAAALADRSAALTFPLRAALVQLHVFGGMDDNTPYSLSADLLSEDSRARVKVFEGADHDCCWLDLWPTIVAQFQQLMEASELTRANSSVR
jgi:pimeloyl-ACP methyl ester carboxylesterase